jgi:hypothetical protein
MGTQTSKIKVTLFINELRSSYNAGIGSPMPHRGSRYPYTRDKGRDKITIPGYRGS